MNLLSRILPTMICMSIASPLLAQQSSTQPALPDSVKLDLFLLIGTSAVVYPAAGLAPIAKSSGARVVEINIAAGGLSDGVDEFLQGPSGELLPQLIA